MIDEGGKMMNIGIIGTGNISHFLLEEIEGKNKTQNEHINITAVFGRNKEKGNELSKTYHVDFYNKIDQFLQSPTDLIVEAATVEVAMEQSEKILKSGKHLMLSSVGSMGDWTFYQKIEKLAKQEARHVYIPSGAVGGIDVLKAANVLGELKTVSLTTKKSPQSLGLEEDPEEAKVIFEGAAGEAIQQFPKNINVSIVLSLAGIGTEKTKVRIVADPNISRNTHVIEASGHFGSFHFTVENEPMPSNPKTSYLAALSILSTLQNIDHPIKIGN